MIWTNEEKSIILQGVYVYFSSSVSKISDPIRLDSRLE